MRAPKTLDFIEDYNLSRVAAGRSECVHVVQDLGTGLKESGVKIVWQDTFGKKRPQAKRNTIMERTKKMAACKAFPNFPPAPKIPEHPKTALDHVLVTLSRLIRIYDADDEADPFIGKKCEEAWKEDPRIGRHTAVESVDSDLFWMKRHGKFCYQMMCRYMDGEDSWIVIDKSIMTDVLWPAKTKHENRLLALYVGQDYTDWKRFTRIWIQIIIYDSSMLPYCGDTFRWV